MENKNNTVIHLLILALLICLTYAGYLSYKSIDYDILNKLESTPLNLPEVAQANPTPTPETLQSR